MAPGAAEQTPLVPRPELRSLSLQPSPRPAWSSGAQDAKWEQPDGELEVAQPQTLPSSLHPRPLHDRCPDAARMCPPPGLRPHCFFCLTLSSSCIISGGTTLTSPPASRASRPRLLFPGGGSPNPEEETDEQAAGCSEPCQVAPPPGSLHPARNNRSLPPLSQVLGGRAQAHTMLRPLPQTLPESS